MTENCRLEGVEVRQNCQESRLGEMCVDMEAALVLSSRSRPTWEGGSLGNHSLDSTIDARAGRDHLA